MLESSGKLSVNIPSWLRVTLLAAFLTAGGCAPRDRMPETEQTRGIPFERVEADRADLPPGVKDWVQENSRRTGTFVKDDAERYILVAWGEKATGGYSVRIEDVAAGRRGEVVVVRLDAPEPGQPVTEAITYPFDLVRTRRLAGPVEFAYLGNLTLDSQPAAAAPPEEPAEPGARSRNFLVSMPAPGERISSPVTMMGKARVFEAVFFVEITDGRNLLARQVVYACGGAPAWGAFTVSIPFARPAGPDGSIIFGWHSPKDGSRQEELVLPVRFAGVE